MSYAELWNIYLYKHMCISDFRGVSKESIGFSWSKLFCHHNAERVCIICIKLYARGESRWRDNEEEGCGEGVASERSLHCCGHCESQSFLNSRCA